VVQWQKAQPEAAGLTDMLVISSLFSRGWCALQLLQLCTWKQWKQRKAEAAQLQETLHNQHLPTYTQV
jgi:hypothetical protein